MARPTKQGVDYFPLDVHLDDKFKFIEIKYKLEGFAILIKLMQRIYSYGYWCKWTDDEALLFSDEIRTDYNLVINVVNEAVEREIFNKDIFQTHRILTSNGIQKRYKEIVRRRKDVEVKEEYLLVDNNFGVNDDINPTSSKQNDDKSTQSKVKESKENKTNDYSSQFEEWWNEYPRKVEKKKSFSAFKTALKNYSFDLLLGGLKGYKEHIKQSNTAMNYIKHPTSFLNGESFKDYVSEPKQDNPVMEERMKRIDELYIMMDYAETPEEYKRIEAEREALINEVRLTG